jgi:hypothetical protein
MKRELNPKLVKEWDYEKNGSLRPEDCTGGSNKIVWWLCSKGHSWSAAIYSRSAGNGCPYCSGNKVWPGFNDIITTHPEIAKEWDYERNGDLHPSQFSIGSHAKLWWQCKEGHSWQTVLSNRRQHGCPVCAGNILTVGLNDLQTVNPTLAAEWDTEKNDNLPPCSVAANNNQRAWWRCEHNHSWQATICSRNKGNRCPYCAGRKVLAGFNDLASTYPDVAKTWHLEKNGDLRPEDVAAASNKKVWWKCDRGHSWIAMVNSRTRGSGCPYCTGRKAWIGFNDLPTTSPETAKEWDFDKNGKLQPEQFTVGSNAKVWWKCEHGHSWEARIYSRKGSGCPYCANYLALKGYNDLLSIAPKLCEEWNYEMNAPLKPDEVTAGSNKVVWWKCAKGHTWRASIVDRRSERGCPVCAGKAVFAGYNDLKTLRPDIAEEWDYDKNGELLPEQFTSQTSKYVWWLCKRGHSYKAKVANRYHGTGCPYCAGGLPILGETDLATIHPELLSEWDYEKNGSKLPEHYTGGSNKKVWWRCPRGHSWKAFIISRIYGAGCPYCSGKVFLRTRLVK